MKHKLACMAQTQETRVGLRHFSSPNVSAVLPTPVLSFPRYKSLGLA